MTERFTGAEVVDPAVETELLYASQRCGFEVVDAAKVRQAAGGKAEWWLHAGEMIDVVIIGEAIWTCPVDEIADQPLDALPRFDPPSVR